MKKTNQNRHLCICSFFVTFLIMLLLFWHYGYAPFGNNSLASHDARIQYLDFFSYFKDVLSGKNDLTYTFSKSLGGNNIGVFSYYLASPFSLLVVFFKKSQMHSFFNIEVMLKLSLASFTFCWFLIRRFHRYLSARADLIKSFCVVMLSVSYGLCQYSVAQSCNIMWLDGVYMLPLILLGVYQLLYTKTTWKLVVPVALSILFNWYTGGINCLFSGIWMLLELCLYLNSSDFSRKALRDCVRSFIHYIGSMLLGVLCSCVLFLPTVSAMKNSNRGSLDFSSLFNFRFTGNFSNVLSGYVFGAVSKRGRISLFCGILAITGLIALFLSRKVSARLKTIFGSFILLSVLLYYWKPFYTVFSLFKSVTSYWYRFSYVSIFLILFIAAYFYLAILEQESPFILVKSSAVFALLLILTRQRMRGDEALQQTCFTVVATFFTAVVFAMFVAFTRKQLHLYRWISFVAAAVLLFGGTAYNTRLLMDQYRVSEDDSYQLYQTTTQKQISNIQNMDNGTYRISQTAPIHESEQHRITANYNESYGYNYRSISSYTSSPDDRERTFMEHIGYRICGENISVTNNSILGADSLLGVKYVLSPYQISGLEEISSPDSDWYKKTYQNPYALPLALVYSNDQKQLKEPDGKNPFEYQNYLYSLLYGKNVSIYEPLSYSLTSTGDTETNTPQSYSVQLKPGNYAFYGNIPWNTSRRMASIDVNHVYSTNYSCWLGPSVFYIPVSENDASAALTIDSPKGYDIRKDAEQFYGLNLDTLGQITRKLSSSRPSKLTMDNGYVYAECDSSSENQSLYLSVPYDKGWKIYINGKKSSYDLIGDCLYSLPLKKGKNIIEMKYTCPLLHAGTAVSVFGILMTAAVTLIENKKRRSKK